MKKVFAYIGSWDVRGTPRAFGICAYNSETGKLDLIKEGAGGTICVGCACIDTERGLLYCTDEKPGFPQERVGGGRIHVLKIVPESGELIKIDCSTSWGAQPSYVRMDGTGQYLVVSNYGSRDAYSITTHKSDDGRYVLDINYSDSSVVLVKLNEDGTIGEACDIFTLQGSGPKHYQVSPHAHCVEVSPSGKMFAVCDKGADRLYMLKIDYTSGKFVLCGKPYESNPGSAPRYCVFHPTRPYLFFNKEGENTVTSLRYDEHGQLEHICTIRSLPEAIDPHKDIMQSDLKISRSGKYIYDLHRISNTISVLKVCDENGAIELIQSIRTDINNPRACAFSPDEKFLLVTSWLSNEVFSFPIGEDGRLSPATSVLKDVLLPGTINFFESKNVC